MVPQLLRRYIGSAEKLGYRVRYGLLVSYMGFPEQTIKYARKVAQRIPIFLLTEKQLRSISMYSLIRLP